MFKKDYKQENIKIQKKLRRKISDTRYLHSLGVAYTSAALGMKYGVDIDKLIVAGMLHDCAKYMSPDDLLKFALKKKIDITEIERMKPDLLHAKVGAYFAQKKYHIKDSIILDAICCHTTGKPEMTLFEKIIYVSDYIEPSRDKQPRLDEVRKEAFENIDNCIKMILSDTLSYLKEEDVMIDELTQKTYDYYMSL